MRSKMRLLPAAIATTICSTFLMTPTHAEEVSSRGLLEEVIVTAQKREQSANDVPIAINAFSGDDLSTLGVDDTADLSGLVPGFTMARSMTGTPIYSLRGVGFNTPNVSSTSPVGVYFDEAAYPYPYMSKGLSMDVERVEVLKGPQGTLYGRNTTGGLINFITKKPTEEFETGVKFKTGSYDSYDVEAFVSGALTEKVRGRVVVRTEQSDEGWQKSVTRDETNGESDRSAIRAIFEADLSDSLTATLTASYWQDKSDVQMAQVIAFTPEVPAEALPALEGAVLSNPDARDADWVSASQPEGAWPGSTYASNPRPELGGDSNQSAFSLRFDKDLSDTMTLTSLTGYIDVERNDVNDRDGTQYEVVVFADVGEIQSFSQEFRLTGSNEEGSLNYVAGLYYSQDDALDTSNAYSAETSTLRLARGGIAAAAGAFFGATSAEQEEITGSFRTFQNYSEVESESWAIFGQFDYALTDALNLTVGARYTEDRKDFKGCSRDIDGDQQPHAWWEAAAPIITGGAVPYSLGQALNPGDCVGFNAEYTAFLGANPSERELNEESISGKVALSWTTDDGSLFYASINRGFKSGAFPQLSASNSSQFAPAVQEELVAYEIGTKLELLESVQLNLSAYYYDYTDKQVFGQVQDRVFSTLTRLVNVPESKVTGIEFDATWFPADMTVVRIGGAFMDTEIKKFKGFDKGGNFVDFSGEEFEYSPSFQGNALIAQGISWGDNLESWITLDAQYSGEQQGDFLGTDTFAVDSYTVVGLRASLESADGDWSVAAFGRNITDEYYWNAVQNMTDTTFRYAAMPRTWGVELNYNW